MGLVGGKLSLVGLVGFGSEAALCGAGVAEKKKERRRQRSRIGT